MIDCVPASQESTAVTFFTRPLSLPIRMVMAAVISYTGSVKTAL